jgi:hypothetical protein
MSWLFVPGSEASVSESERQIPNVVRSVTWRGKPFTQLSWLREWHRDSWIQRLSGLTCSPSTASLGVDAWISSLRKSPKAKTGRSRASFAPSIPVSSFWPAKTGGNGVPGLRVRGTNARTSPFTPATSVPRTTRGAILYWPRPEARVPSASILPDYPEPKTQEPWAQNVWAFRRARPRMRASDHGPSKAVLNPSFYEAVLGYPTGWTDCAS